MDKRAQKNFIEQAAAEALADGARLTEPRRLVLEIIAAASKPLGAYDILEALGEKMHRPKPPTAYRAIDFWIERGIIHKIESLNAFVPCQSDHRHDGSQFLICDSCGTVVETHLCELPRPLADKAAQARFTLHRWNVELHGTCKKCDA